MTCEEISYQIYKHIENCIHSFIPTVEFEMFLHLCYTFTLPFPTFSPLLGLLKSLVDCPPAISIFCINNKT